MKRVLMFFGFMLMIYSLNLFTQTADIHAEPLQIKDVSEKNKEFNIKFEDIKEKTEEYEIDMKIPIISGLQDQVFQVKFNYGIKSKAEDKKKEFIKEAKQFAQELREKGQPLRPFQLFIEPSVKMQGEIISIKSEDYIYKGGANGIQKISALNILNQKKAKYLTFADLFKEDLDYKEVINDMVKKEIEDRRAKGESFFEGEEGFQSVTDEQKFYLEENQLVLAFDEYEIAPGYMGTQTFSIPFAEIHEMLKPEIYEAIQKSELVWNQVTH
ncbi:DUF3298 and DUF4163 domain-containing protein [Salinibacillus xinjiangensis]|uniref:DUF3298 domain-containing protein n=1 Tax=Salinibacillus xinjiangensis TaxID=1229268 RepID=A0A6G1X835_9BACI|nr:DUF3298 and DUF4163 domain-containing protein [Salinibacillus xinjiangensis]MRG87107.1 DUF3298 domain-containing protein [Salinibacillus xinjiangensis]